MNDYTPTIIKYDIKPPTYSATKLNTYSNCSQSYKYKYIDKIKAVKVSVSTIIGSLLHNSLEIYLHPDNNELFIYIFEIQSKLSLIDRKYIITEVDSNLYSKLYEELLEYSRDVHILNLRASSLYTGKYPIRTKDGKAPTNPLMTSGWKEAEKNLRLSIRKSKLDKEFKEISVVPEVSIVDAFSEAYTLATLYITPKEIVRTIALEFPISDYNYDTGELTNPVLMPPEFGGSEDIYFNGYIDWVGYVYYEGKERLALIDYKTSKENLTVDKLQYHSQLLSYVYALEKLLDIKVEVIGVHSLRHKKLALCKVDRDILKVANTSLFSRHLKIKDNHFYQEHMPDSQYSKCLNSFGRNCEYLSICHPKMYNTLHPNTIDAELDRLLDI